ncbi:MAG: MFS transporter [Chloroflexi bacterium]|nr:MFS transporter [Chloroflexota bacterium]
MAGWARAFFTIWTAQALSLLGSNLVQFALVWWLTTETGSATVLALAWLLAIVPQVALGPLVGTLVDRWNRRRVMIAADSAIATATVGLALLFLADLAQVWHIYVIMFVRSLGAGFHWPAMQASTSLMVPEQHLTRINGMNQTLNGVLNILAPPLGALLLDVLPMQGVLAVDVGTALVAITPLLFIAIPQPQSQSSGDDDAGPDVKPSIWADFRAGLHYMWRWPGLRIILVMTPVLNFLFVPAAALMPLLVKEYFEGDAYSLALFQGMFGGGMLLGGVTLSVWGGFKRAAVTSMAGMMGLGVGALVIGLTPPALFGLAVAAACLCGFMFPITGGPIFAMLQKCVAPEMQGRVFTFVMALVGLMMPLSLAIAGPVANQIGSQVWFIMAGVGSVAAGAYGLSAAAVRNLEADMSTETAEMDTPDELAAENEAGAEVGEPVIEAVD